MRSDAQWLEFVDNWKYFWGCSALMVVAYLVASGIDATGPRTSFAIGLAGAAALAFHGVLPWVLLIRAWLTGHHLALPKRDARFWTGLASTAGRWLLDEQPRASENRARGSLVGVRLPSYSLPFSLLYLFGWIFLFVLTGLSLISIAN
ncbi:MAG: hypothetical protein ABI559_00090 [Chloroflexota bacterium]